MNSPIKVKVENNDTGGCLFVIFFVLIIILYQLVAIKEVVLNEAREKQHENVTQEEVQE